MIKSISDIVMLYYCNDGKKFILNMERFDMKSLPSNEQFRVLEQTDKIVRFKDLIRNKIFYLKENKVYFGNYYEYEIDMESTYGE